MAYNSRQANTGMMATIKEMVVLLLVVFLIRTFIFGLYQVPTGSMETTMLVGERFFADKLTPFFKKPERGEIVAFNDPIFDYSQNSVVRAYQEYVGWPIWPWGPVNWTKRVIGIPGDHVKGVVEDGKPVVYLNDVKLEEPYLNKYPLLAVWKCDPTKTYEPDYDWRSYDPNVPFLAQPYYRVQENLIVRPFQLRKDYLEAINPTITAEGLLLREPGKAIDEKGLRRMHNTAQGFWTCTDEFDIKLGPDQYWLMGDNRRGSHDCRFFGPVAGRLIHGRILFRIWSIDSNESWWIWDLIKHPIDFWQRMRWSRFFERVK